VTLSKPVVDGLTFWTDDIGQCLFGDLERTSASDTSGRSRDPSMIGSRFFAKRTASTGSSESGGEVRKSEIVVKVSIGEG
jgi:autophagy-related protein 2